MPEIKRMPEQEAYNTLLVIEPGTIIDDNWYDDFYHEWRTLEALLVLTGCRHYREVVDKYEGWSVDQLLDAYLTQTLDRTDPPARNTFNVGWTVEYSGVETVTAEDEDDARDKVEHDISENMQKYIGTVPADISTHQW